MGERMKNFRRRKNLCGLGMSQTLLYAETMSEYNENLNELLKTKDSFDIGYALEVDLQIRENAKSKFSVLLFCLKMEKTSQ